MAEVKLPDRIAKKITTLASSNVPLTTREDIEYVLLEFAAWVRLETLRAAVREFGPCDKMRGQNAINILERMAGEIR